MSLNHYILNDLGHGISINYNNLNNILYAFFSFYPLHTYFCNKYYTIYKIKYNPSQLKHLYNHKGHNSIQ
jgi:hypothetical protein